MSEAVVFSHEDRTWLKKTADFCANTGWSKEDEVLKQFPNFGRTVEKQIEEASEPWLTLEKMYSAKFSSGPAFTVWAWGSSAR